jgi:hypothetical protein
LDLRDELQLLSLRFAFGHLGCESNHFRLAIPLPFKQRQEVLLGQDKNDALLV